VAEKVGLRGLDLFLAVATACLSEFTSYSGVIKFAGELSSEGVVAESYGIAIETLVGEEGRHIARAGHGSHFWYWGCGFRCRYLSGLDGSDFERWGELDRLMGGYSYHALTEQSSSTTRRTRDYFAEDLHAERGNFLSNDAQFF